MTETDNSGSNNTKTNIQKNNFNNQKQKKDIENLSNEIVKLIRKNNRQTKTFTIKFNLVFLFLGIFLLVVVFFNFTRIDTAKEKITLNQIINGIKENKFSQIFIQNDGKISLKSKTVLRSAVDDFDINFDISKVEFLDEQKFVNIVFSQDIFSQFRNIFLPSSSNNIVLSEILIGDTFIAGIPLNKSSPIIILQNLQNPYEFLESVFNDRGVKKSALPIKITLLNTNLDKTIEIQSFVNRKESLQFSRVFVIGNFVYGILKEQFVNNYALDWNTNISSFISILQSEGISLDNQTIEFNPLNVPQSITFGDILTFLTLIGILFVGFILFKGAQSSGMGITQFGQSRAKIFFGSKTDTTFRDVAGIDEAKDELNEIVEFLKDPMKFRKLGARIPKGVLMVGPPGTGKTLLARAIAGEAGVPFFHTSGSEFEEMLVGAGASRVRDLFAKAKKASPSLIFIDEIDAVARKRGTKIQSGTTEQTLNQILVEMDGFEKNTNVIVLAATNRPDVLDPAILRPGRFDRQIRIDLPDMEGRKQILQVHGKNKPFAIDVDLEKIAKRTVGFTGADLENILNEAAILAARNNKKEIQMIDIEEAVSKVMLGPAKKSRKRTDKELNLVAYHEAGHAIVAKFIPEATPVDKISIISRGSSGGVTMFIPEKDEYIVSKKKILAQICVALGGRAAEEIALDDISTGASNDIERATAMARKMVQKFGMSEKLGLVQYGDFEENEYLGYAYTNTKEYSDKTAEMIDQEVKSIIDDCYKKSISILKNNRQYLDKLSNLLLEREVVSKEEFESLFV